MKHMSDHELIQKAQVGDSAAFAILLERYEPLVKKMARGFASAADGMQEADYLQEGRIGLIEAVRGFDASKGSSFGTYAKQCCLRRPIFDLHAKAAGLTTYQQNKYNQVMRAFNQYCERHRRLPTSEELADVIEEKHDFRPRPETLERILQQGHGTIPIYTDYPDDEEPRGHIPIDNTLPDEGVDEEIKGKVLHRLIWNCFDRKAKARSFLTLHTLRVPLNYEYKKIREVLAVREPLLPCLLKGDDAIPLYWHEHHRRLDLPEWLPASWEAVRLDFFKPNGMLKGTDALRKSFMSGAQKLLSYGKAQGY